MREASAIAAAGIDLIDRIVGRDREAVRELYDLHGRLLFAVVFRILRERAEAEDALQDVFLRVWERADTYNPACGAVSAWLARIARNRAIDRLRARQRGDRREIKGDTHRHEILTAADDPAARVEGQDAAAELLAGVDPQTRELLECACFEGYTQSELALRFHLPLGTVKTRMRKALQEIRRRYHREADSA